MGGISTIPSHGGFSIYWVCLHDFLIGAYGSTPVWGTTVETLSRTNSPGKAELGTEVRAGKSINLVFVWVGRISFFHDANLFSC
jgi:hypothetical protein